MVRPETIAATITQTEDQAATLQPEVTIAETITHQEVIHHQVQALPARTIAVAAEA